MRILLFRSAAIWTAVGLASGLFYREFTKLNGVAGGTQLAVVHTHTLALGTMMMLLWLALVAQFWPAVETGRDRLLRSGFWLWQAGLVLTVGGLLVKGCLQVLDHGLQDSPMIAGFSGLGHMTLTAAFVVFFLALHRALKRADEAVTAPVHDAVRV